MDSKEMIRKFEQEEEIRRRQRLREMELEKLEVENRHRQLEALEAERRAQQEKFQVEAHLSDLCLRFNEFKEKLNRALDESLLPSYDEELKVLNEELRGISLSTESNGLFSGLDQATLTQFDLLKSFSVFLGSQLETIRREYEYTHQNRSKLSELELNLNKYVSLAKKFCSQATGDGQQNEQINYIQSIGDLENRIESILSIEEATQNCLRQISELGATCHVELETGVFQPLAMHCAELQRFAQQWKKFDYDFNHFKEYFNSELKLDSLEKIEDEVGGDLEPALAKYEAIKDKLGRKMWESEALLTKGSVLFSSASFRRASIQVPQANKDFNEIKEKLENAAKFLEDKCFTLKTAIQLQKGFKILENEISSIEFEIRNLVGNRGVTTMEPEASIQDQIQAVHDLKKRLRSLSIECEQRIAAFQETNLKSNSDLIFSIEKRIYEASNKLSNLEVRLKYFFHLNSTFSELFW